MAAIPDDDERRTGRVSFGRDPRKDPGNTHLSSQHMSDIHFVIIYYTRQMVGRKAIGLHDDHVVHFNRRKGFGSPVDEVGER